MAWAVEYRGEFDDLSYFGSTQGLAWTIDIELDGYGGEINEMRMAGRPVVIEHLSASDDLISSPVKGSKATINVWSESHFQYTALYSVENMKRRVSIYHDSTLYWRGYLTAGYTEPYDDTPYEVSLTANDGLGLLHDIDFTPGAEGRRYESAILFDILGEIGFTSFKEFVNVYEDRMSKGTGDSPFDQTLIHTDVFEDMNCYDVLV